MDDTIYIMPNDIEMVNRINHIGPVDHYMADNCNALGYKDGL